MENEIWLPVKGFEGRYEVSNRGRVKSVGRIILAKDGSVRDYQDKFLKLTPHKSRGYVSVRLYHIDGKTWKHIEVHRLVALHFIDNVENHPVVNHLDTNRSNNHVNNLQWTTHADNITYKGCHRKAGEKRKKKVYQYSNDMDFIRAWSSVSEPECLGYSSNVIRKVCLGLRKRYRGFYWTYK